jgi:hypothetical protein
VLKVRSAVVGSAKYQPRPSEHVASKSCRIETLAQSRSHFFYQLTSQLVILFAFCAQAVAIQRDRSGHLHRARVEPRAVGLRAAGCDGHTTSVRHHTHSSSVQYSREPGAGLRLVRYRGVRQAHWLASGRDRVAETTRWLQARQFALALARDIDDPAALARALTACGFTAAYNAELAGVAVHPPISRTGIASLRYAHCWPAHRTSSPARARSPRH